MLQVGAVSLGWSGTPLQEVFETIAGMGGECVEINGNTQRHHGITIDHATAPQIRRWAADAGLQISAVSGYSDFAQTDPDALDEEIARLMQSCHAAHALGVPIVRAFVGDVKPGITYDEVYPHIVSAFQQACGQAEPLGIALAIENHGHLVNDGPMLAALYHDIGADNLGFTLDTGNFAWAGHNPGQVRKDLDAILPYCLNLHVKDGKWTDEGFVFVPAGEGEMPLAWIIKQLEAQLFEGNVHSEYEGGGDFLAGTRTSIACLKTLMTDYRACKDTLLR